MEPFGLTIESMIKAQTTSHSKWQQLKQLDSHLCLSDDECQPSTHPRKSSSSDMPDSSSTLTFSRENSLNFASFGECGFDILAQNARRQRRERLLSANFDNWEQNQTHAINKRVIKHYSLERCSFSEITDHRVLSSTIENLRKRVNQLNLLFF